MTATKPLDLQAIKARMEGCIVAVNLECHPLGRAMVWAKDGAPLIRTDIPALVAEVLRLREALDNAQSTMNDLADSGDYKMPDDVAYALQNARDDARAALGQGEGR